MNLPITKSMISILFFNDFMDNILTLGICNHWGQVHWLTLLGR